jgi:D-alanyl-D-alanine carboxypeptidase/D-alanyl-D-alanine-endopeptidase (penicillin-binding protein 4)
MKYKWMVVFLLLSAVKVNAQQTLWSKLQAAWDGFSNDSQLKYALAGICVLDAQTGKPLFEKNSNIGMAPASTQKVLTSIAAFEALGSTYQYKTRLGYTGKIENKKLLGNLVVEGSGDPTFGSWRYASTKQNVVLKKMADATKQAGIETISRGIIGTDNGFDINPVPDGWIWGDMGNYYGAGHWAINWNENQYDILNKTGSRENTPVEIVNNDADDIPFATIINDVKSGKPNTADGSVIYAAPYSHIALFQGKLEPNQSKFTVSGAMPEADLQALTAIENYFSKNNISVTGKTKPYLSQLINNEPKPTDTNYFLTLNSPSLDSIVYWFMRKSVNLYGEAMIRTIGLEKKGLGSTKKGLEWVDSFYQANGFDTEAMHMYDGSGLSPANRTTPAAMAKALYFAKSKSWFPSFYDALPLYNGMKLKSGTINRVKSYAGYHKSKSGREFVVCIMVNNYNSSPSALVSKMFKVLDELK